MPFLESNFLSYFTFELFQSEPLIHAVMSRHGGVSPHPWMSLNVGGTVGDTPERVAENRRRAFAGLQLSYQSVFDVWQVHSSVVIITDRPRKAQEPYQQADAILTAQPGVTLFMRFADCAPIMLYDPVKKVIGLVHAGWKGTVQQISRRAITAMQEYYGSQPQDILAGIGPSIGPDHYQVGMEVIRGVHETFGEQATKLLLPDDNPIQETDHRLKFDLWSANRLLLEQAGVRSIEVCNICTACHVDDWYSHRAEAGKTGRFGVVIALSH